MHERDGPLADSAGAAILKAESAPAATLRKVLPWHRERHCRVDREYLHEIEGGSFSAAAAETALSSKLEVAGGASRKRKEEDARDRLYRCQYSRNNGHILKEK